MAYISKAEVQAKSIKLKEINKKYGVKATFSASGSNRSALKLSISSGVIDFIENYIEVNKRTEMRLRFGSVDIKQIEEDLMNSKYIQVNEHYLDSRFDSTALMYLQEVYALMCEGHYDKSDSQSDYFECSWYNSIYIGRWDRGYKVTK